MSTEHIVYIVLGVIVGDILAVWFGWCLHRAKASADDYRNSQDAAESERRWKLTQAGLDIERLQASVSEIEAKMGHIGRAAS